MEPPPSEALARVMRDERPRVLATLIRVTGSIDVAEDAVQDAAVRALDTWPRDGIPPNPRAWLVLTAKRRAVDVLRREARRTGKEREAVYGEQPASRPESDSAVRDDLLRLVFTCCHPTLAPQAQVALALRTLGGLSTAETARALLVPEATMAKRLTRAKQKIAQARIPYRVPADEELPERLAGVTATVYLIFNEGYLASGGGELTRPDLCEGALRLARLLAGLMPDEASVLGLLALLLLLHSRRDARTDAEGAPVLLADQDRGRWDTEAIREGVTLAGRALRRSPDTPDPYAVQAAVATCHALAGSWGETDWDAVLSWYDVLLTVQDTAVVRLNRAVAVAERDGPTVALEEVDALTGLDGYPWWHATRAELLRRLDRTGEARDAYDRALAAGLADPQAAHVRRRSTGL